MKLPNGYGSVIKLSGKRRKPYAVRLSYIAEEDGVFKQKFKYLDYFEKKEMAYSYLAELNNSNVVQEHVKYSEIPTFAELYEKWKKYKKSLPVKITSNTWKNYDLAFRHFSDLHHRKFNSIRADEIQEIVNQYCCKSRTTLSNMRTVLNNLYKYALMNKYVDSDLSTFITYTWTDSTEQIHGRYTDEEIAKLWNKLYEINNVDLILITIYTGLRPTELLEIRTENVYIEEKYMIGGMKTEAGKDRTIPISDKILPLIKNRYDKNKKYLVNNKYGNHYTYGSYVSANFNTVMNRLEMKHLPHDGRHTFASLMDNVGANEVCLKLIMGHSFGNNITKGIYTHKTLSELLFEVNKI